MTDERIAKAREGYLMSRVWAMPNKYTFQVPPLLEIVEKHRHGAWVDPFAGFHSPVEPYLQNDLNPDTPAEHHIEADTFLAQFGDGEMDGAIFDPPYSITQVSRSYKGMGLKFTGKENPTGGFPRVKDQIARILRHGVSVYRLGGTALEWEREGVLGPLNTLCAVMGETETTRWWRWSKNCD